MEFVGTTTRVKRGGWGSVDPPDNGGQDSNRETGDNNWIGDVGAEPVKRFPFAFMNPVYGDSYYQYYWPSQRRSYYDYPY